MLLSPLSNKFLCEIAENTDFKTVIKDTILSLMETMDELNYFKDTNIKDSDDVINLYRKIAHSYFKLHVIAEKISSSKIVEIIKQEYIFLEYERIIEEKKEKNIRKVV